MLRRSRTGITLGRSVLVRSLNIKLNVDQSCFVSNFPGRMSHSGATSRSSVMPVACWTRSSTRFCSSRAKFLSVFVCVSGPEFLAITCVNYYGSMMVWIRVWISGHRYLLVDLDKICGSQFDLSDAFVQCDLPRRAQSGSRRNGIQSANVPKHNLESSRIRVVAPEI